MFDPLSLLNAMMTQGVRGAPLYGLIDGAGDAPGKPLGVIIAGLVDRTGRSRGHAHRPGLSEPPAAPLWGAPASGGTSNLRATVAKLLDGKISEHRDSAEVLRGLTSGLFGARSRGLSSAAGLALLAGIAAHFLSEGTRGSGNGHDPRLAIAETARVDRTAAGRRALLCIRAMIAAAKADGPIDAEEQRLILAGLEEAGAGPEACAFVAQQIAESNDLDGIVAEIPDRVTAAQVYMAAIFAIDGRTPREKRFLSELARRLDLPALPAERLDA